MRKFLRSTLFAAGVAAAAAPALAEGLTVTVSYADLDLTLDGDVATLNERLEQALVQACRADTGPSLFYSHAVEGCVADGMRKGAKVIADHRSRALAEVAD